MSGYSAIAFISCVVLGLGIALLIYVLLAGSLREVLNNLIRMPEATEFYLRSLALVLVLATLSRVIFSFKVANPPLPANAPPPPPPHFMEYVWDVMARLRDVMKTLANYLLFYVGVITVLAAVLRGREWNTKAS